MYTQFLEDSHMRHVCVLKCKCAWVFMHLAVAFVLDVKLWCLVVSTLQEKRDWRESFILCRVTLCSHS